MAEAAIEAGCRPAGILTTSPSINISYAPNGVKLVTHFDFAAWGRERGVPVAVTQHGLDGATDIIASWRPDVVLAAGWYYHIGARTRSLARLACAGFHASLLPAYAGGAPVNWAIINGENETGMTLFLLDEGVDTGHIVAQGSTPIHLADTVATVQARLAELAAAMLKEALPRAGQWIATARPQDLGRRTVMPQRRPEDGRIDWRAGALTVYNLIRGVTAPYPGAFTHHDSRRITVWSAEFFGTAPADRPGRIIEARGFFPTGLVVGTGEDETPLLLTSLSLDGGPPMPAWELARKAGLRPGDILA